MTKLDLNDVSYAKKEHFENLSNALLENNFIKELKISNITNDCLNALYNGLKNIEKFSININNLKILLKLYVEQALVLQFLVNF